MMKRSPVAGFPHADHKRYLLLLFSVHFNWAPPSLTVEIFDRDLAAQSEFGEWRNAGRDKKCSPLSYRHFCLLERSLVFFPYIRPPLNVIVTVAINEKAFVPPSKVCSHFCPQRCQPFSGRLCFSVSFCFFRLGIFLCFFQYENRFIKHLNQIIS